MLDVTHHQEKANQNSRLSDGYCQEDDTRRARAWGEGASCRWWDRAGEQSGGAERPSAPATPLFVLTRTKQKHKLNKVHAAHVHCGTLHGRRDVGVAWAPDIGWRGRKRRSVHATERHSATEEDEAVPAAATQGSERALCSERDTPRGPDGPQDEAGTNPDSANTLTAAASCVAGGGSGP